MARIYNPYQSLDIMNLPPLSLREAQTIPHGLLEQIFDSVQELVLAIDSDHRITAYNKNYLQLVEEQTGLRPQIGMSLSELHDQIIAIVPLPERTLNLEGMLLSKLESILQGDSFEEDQVLSFGHGHHRNKKYFHVSYKPIYDDMNVVTGAVACATETTQDVHALASKNQALKKANGYLDNFVHAIAHDLRTPIANLKQIAELLLMLESSDDPIYSKLELSVDRLDRTVQGLINIIDAQRIENKSISTISFEKSLQALQEDFADKIRELGATVRTDFAVKDISYIAPYLESIIRNLFQNALKYSQKGRSPEMYIKTRKEGPYTLFSIQDNGIGMNLEEVGDRLFRPFKRFSNQAEGNGIGLHLVKSMVEKNNGYIHVDSKPGIGTRFDIYLTAYSKLTNDYDYQ